MVLEKGLGVGEAVSGAECSEYVQHCLGDGTIHLHIEPEGKSGKGSHSLCH